MTYPAIPDMKPIRPKLSPLSTRNVANMDCDECEANLLTHVQTQNLTFLPSFERFVKLNLSVKL